MARESESEVLETFAGTRTALLDWYDSVKRDLPWRRNTDPYRVWLSEIMLQQTQVATVIPYFESFVERYPDVESLAAAEIDEVLALWSGLGYYRRARQLHAAARQVVEAGGEWPGSAHELRDLPGIGSYTSAAIASIAFGEKVAVLDGNVERVTSRLLALEGNPKHKVMRVRLLEAAEGLLDDSRPGDGNQALMELGATVCRPRNPSCLLCPLSRWCRGKGRAEDYPSPRPRRKVERLRWAMALVVEQEGRILFFRRDRSEEIMPGLWELPTVSLGALSTKRPGAEAREAELRAMAAELGRLYGGNWTLRPLDRSFRHGITHRAITVDLYRAELRFEASEVNEGREAAWIDLGNRGSYAMSSMVEKALAQVADELGAADSE